MTPTTEMKKQLRQTRRDIQRKAKEVDKATTASLRERLSILQDTLGTAREPAEFDITEFDLFDGNVAAEVVSRRRLARDKLYASSAEQEAARASRRAAHVAAVTKKQAKRLWAEQHGQRLRPSWYLLGPPAVARLEESQDRRQEHRPPPLQPAPVLAPGPAGPEPRPLGEAPTKHGRAPPAQLPEASPKHGRSLARRRAPASAAGSDAGPAPTAEGAAQAAQLAARARPVVGIPADEDGLRDHDLCMAWAHSGSDMTLRDWLEQCAQPAARGQKRCRPGAAERRRKWRQQPQTVTMNGPAASQWASRCWSYPQQDGGSL